MANLMTTPRIWRNKAILVKLETAYNADSVPTGAANWIEARNLQLTPLDADRAPRNIDMPYMGNSGSVFVSGWAKLSFDVAMAGSGAAGTAPKYGPTLQACGTAETITAGTSVIYNLVSQAFASVSIYVNIDGVLHKATGSRGDVKGKSSAKGTPMFSFSFDAVYVAPIADGLPTVTRTGWQIEEGVNSANTLPVTLGGVDLSYSDFEWSFGNKISRIDLPGPQVEVAIIDRAPTASIIVLAPDLATFNPFVLLEAGTVSALTTTHGSAAGKKVKQDLNVRIAGVEYDKIEEQVAYKLTLEPTPVTGNDEIAITVL